MFYSLSDDCHDKIKMALLIDTSSSYGEEDKWEKVKLFVKLFLNHYVIDADKTNLGVITYKTQANILFGLHDKEYQTLDNAITAIDAALTDIGPGGQPWTEKALIKAV